MGLVKNANQARGSEVIALRLGWGGVGERVVPGHHVVNSRAWSSFKLPTHSSLDFSTAYNWGILKPLGNWALRAIAPDRLVWLSG